MSETLFLIEVKQLLKRLSVGLNITGDSIVYTCYYIFDPLHFITVTHASSSVFLPHFLRLAPREVH